MQVTSFRELLVLRIGFAAAQSTQNPICFSLIPELFPKQRTFAMAAYNSAIYMGRALSFAAVVIAGQLGVTHSTSEDVGVQLVRRPELMHPDLAAKEHVALLIECMGCAGALSHQSRAQYHVEQQPCHWTRHRWRACLIMLCLSLCRFPFRQWICPM